MRISKELTEKEWKLVAHLLHIASNQFSNHVCTDCNLEEHGFTKGEWQKLSRRVWAFSSNEPDELKHYLDSPYREDFQMMDYFADVFDPGSSLLEGEE